MSATYRIMVGSVVTIDDELYELRQVSGVQVVLQNVATSVSRAMSIADLLSMAAHPHRGEASRMEISLEVATPDEHALVEQRRFWLDWVDDPQDEEGQRTTRKQRRKIAQKELGVSERTFYRLKSSYVEAGDAGLVPGYGVRRRKNRCDGVWEDVAAGFLDANQRKTAMTRMGVIAAVTDQVRREFPDSEIPSQSTCYKILERLSEGRESFGSASARLSIANSPKGTHGRLTPTMHGEYVVLDTHDLDIYVRTPRERGSKDLISRAQLTVAMDVYTRSVVALALEPFTSQNTVASLLFELCQPVPWPGRVPEHCRFAFHGVPDEIFIGDRNDHWGLPYAPPDSIITDHGKPFTAAHIRSICAKLGISVQLAQTYKPTDKAWLERFFKSLNDGLISKLPGYVGSNVVKRGPDAEADSVLLLADLEHAIREWVCSIYHQTKHAGLCFPELPERAVSPAEMYRVSVAMHGLPRLLLRPEDAFDFLVTVERMIQAAGVTVSKRLYNGPALDPYRGKESTEPRVSHPGKFRFKIDPRDVRFIWFQDPDDLRWHQLEWVHAARIGRPFSLDEYLLIKDMFVEPLPDKAVLEHELATRVAGRADANRKEFNRVRKITEQLPTPHARMAAANDEWSATTGFHDEVRPFGSDTGIRMKPTDQDHEVDDLDRTETGIDWGLDEDDIEIDFFFKDEINE